MSVLRDRSPRFLPAAAQTRRPLVTEESCLAGTKVELMFEAALDRLQVAVEQRDEDDGGQRGDRAASGRPAVLRRRNLR